MKIIQHYDIKLISSNAYADLMRHMIENQIRLIGCFDLIYRIHVGMDDDDLVIVKLAFSDVIYSIDCIGIVNI